MTFETRTITDGDTSPQPIPAPTLLHQVEKTSRLTQPAARPDAHKTTWFKTPAAS
jgi:hypothetical protein